MYILCTWKDFPESTSQKFCGNFIWKFRWVSVKILLNIRLQIAACNRLREFLENNILFELVALPQVLGSYLVIVHCTTTSNWTRSEKYIFPEEFEYSMRIDSIQPFFSHDRHWTTTSKCTRSEKYIFLEEFEYSMRIGHIKLIFSHEPLLNNNF